MSYNLNLAAEGTNLFDINIPALEELNFEGIKMKKIYTIIQINLSWHPRRTDGGHFEGSMEKFVEWERYEGKT